MWKNIRTAVSKKSTGIHRDSSESRTPKEFNTFLKENRAGKDLVRSIEKLAHE